MRACAGEPGLCVSAAASRVTPLGATSFAIAAGFLSHDESTHQHATAPAHPGDRIAKAGFVAGRAGPVRGTTASCGQVAGMTTPGRGAGSAPGPG